MTSRISARSGTRRIIENNPEEYDLIAHPGSILQDGEYKFNLTPSQLAGVIGGLYVLESDQPQLLELYGPDGAEIDWEKIAVGRTRNNYIVLPLSNEQAFERDIPEILKYKTKNHIIILEMENAAYVLQFNNDDFIDGLTTIFDEANMNIEDYLRPVPLKLQGNSSPVSTRMSREFVSRPSTSYTQY